ncbi:hypothetical protein [Nonlabens sp. Asnod3-A02]|uniref:hypothetical protein n=1 Tax=Nonlabens sp. Asnod3-A02 TaxID=3160579 RepID=UPI003867E945
MIKDKPLVEQIEFLLQEESKNSLNDITIGTDLPIWRLIRFNYRVAFLSKKVGFKNDTKTKKITILEVLKYFLLSFSHFLKLIFKSSRKDTLFFAFPRLTNFNGIYLDKFSDPIIDIALEENEYLVIQNNNSGKHFTPRIHEKNVCYSDFEFYTSILLSVFILPFIALLYLNKVRVLKHKVELIYTISFSFYLKTFLTIGTFWIKNCFAKLYLYLIVPKRIVVVSRYVFNPIIYAAKKKGVKVFELQHGATDGATALYSGPYHKMIDPDMFLSFGTLWNASSFGMPKEKIINIGWAYSVWLSNKQLDKIVPLNNSVLVVSSPSHTEFVLQSIIIYADKYRSFNFYIRLHPQERLNSEQLECIKSIENIFLDETSIDSIVAIQKYQYVLGVKSTVLHEALNQNKPVGILQTGFQMKKDSENYNGFFHIITQDGDLNSLLNEQSLVNDTLKAFSFFNNELFKREVLNKY